MCDEEKEWGVSDEIYMHILFISGMSESLPCYADPTWFTCVLLFANVEMTKDLEILIDKDTHR